MDLGDGLSLIHKAIEKEAEERRWELWVAAYPHFSEETYVPFSKFLVESNKPVSTTQHLNADEIIREAERIKQADQGRRDL